MPGKTGLWEYGQVRQKIGGKWAENRRKIGKNRKHVSGKTANASIYNKDGVPFKRKIGGK